MSLLSPVVYRGLQGWEGSISRTLVVLGSWAPQTLFQGAIPWVHESHDKVDQGSRPTLPEGG